MGKTAEREQRLADRLDRKAELLADEFPDTAAELRTEAELARLHATLCHEVEQTRAAWLADRADLDARAAHKAKARELHELRRTWRAMGQLAGTRGPVKVDNNTTEV